jgi:hypothetical protein
LEIPANCSNRAGLIPIAHTFSLDRTPRWGKASARFLSGDQSNKVKSDHAKTQRRKEKTIGQLSAELSRRYQFSAFQASSCE